MSISGQLDTTRVAADGTGRQVSSTTKTEAIWVVTSSSFCARPRKHTCPVTRTVLPAYEVLDLLRPHSIVTRIYADTDNFNKT